MDLTSQLPSLARLAAAAALVALFACGDRRAEFVGARVQDGCDGSWPICDGVAGCILGAESFREGRFPGSGRFVVRVAEPSLVRVSFFLEEVGAAGEQTVITWYEDGCSGRIRQELGGRSFVEEAERSAGLTREAPLNAEGDHLIEYQSDAQARYLVKVDVVPRRTLDR